MSLVTICFLFLASVDLGFGRFLAFWFWTISEVCDLFDVFVLFCLFKICLVTFFMQLCWRLVRMRVVPKM